MMLSEKVALVTGAGSGIGKGLAERFAQAGARVVCSDIEEEKANQVARGLVRPGLGLAMDVAGERSVEDGVAKICRELGGVDILVSNAGIQRVGAAHEMPFSEWKEVLAVHLDGAFLTTRACLRSMYARGGGTILYMGSVHSKEASVLKAPYVTAKHGLLGLCRTVAKEGAPHNVRAHLICPGFVRTPLVDRQIPEQAKALGLPEEQVVKQVMLKQTLDGEFTTVGEVAETALFLATFPSLALTGQSILVSHGWHLG